MQFNSNKKFYNSDKWISHLYYILIKINLLDIYKSKKNATIF